MNNNLLQLHLKLLRECIALHGQHFRTSQAKLDQAYAVVAAAETANPADSTYDTLMKTVENTLAALELKSPKSMPQFSTSDLKQQQATTYFSSPITRHFIENKGTIKQAFGLAENETAHRTPKWATRSDASAENKHKLTAFFNTPEHKELGDALKMPKIAADGAVETIAAQNYRMPIYSLVDGKIVENQALQLTAGEIVMLGDYYGIPSQPIADNAVKDTLSVSDQSKERFTNAYNALAQKGSTKDVQTLLTINTTHYCKNETLNSYLQQIHLVLHNPNTLKLVKNNIDHFDPWAKQAFKSGQAVATDIALLAHEAYAKKDYASANQLLQLAVQNLLYADHFLTDTFSAGHARVGDARLIMKNQFGDLGSILINDMHNEDSVNGVYATIEGRLVKMKGDDHLNDRDAVVAKKYAESAMQIAIDEISDIVVSGKVPEKSAVDQLWPQIPTDDTSIPKQTARMFKCIDGKTYYRSPFNELDPDKVTYEPLSWFKALKLVIERRLFGIEAKDSRLQPVSVVDNGRNAELSTMRTG